MFWGVTVIMVVVDRISKYVHFAALKTNYNCSQMVELFLKKVVKLHGSSKSIISDKDEVFMS